MFAYQLHALTYLMIVIAIVIPEMQVTRVEDMFQDTPKKEMNVARQYCGRSLSMTLQMLCSGIYNSRFKKSAQEMQRDDYESTYNLHPYKSIENARRMIRFKRNSAGIHEECCLKSCSTEELRSYCRHR